jgi:hypothetical protein
MRLLIGVCQQQLPINQQKQGIKLEAISELAKKSLSGSSWQGGLIMGATHPNDWKNRSRAIIYLDAILL